MTRMSKLLTGAALAVMGSASLAMAFQGQPGQQGGAREARAPMMLEMFRSLEVPGEPGVNMYSQFDDAGMPTHDAPASRHFCAALPTASTNEGDAADAEVPGAASS